MDTAKKRLRICSRYVRFAYSDRGIVLFTQHREAGIIFCEKHESSDGENGRAISDFSSSDQTLVC